VTQKVGKWFSCVSKARVHGCDEANKQKHQQHYQDNETQGRDGCHIDYFYKEGRKCNHALETHEAENFDAIALCGSPWDEIRLETKAWEDNTCEYDKLPRCIGYHRYECKKQVPGQDDDRVPVNVVAKPEEEERIRIQKSCVAKYHCLSIVRDCIDHPRVKPNWNHEANAGEDNHGQVFL
jgi:hypothetical protein